MSSISNFSMFCSQWKAPHPENMREQSRAVTDWAVFSVVIDLLWTFQTFDTVKMC